MAGIELKKFKRQPDEQVVKPINKLTDFLNKDITFFKSKLSDKKKEAFYLELSILLIAGVDIKTSLELIEVEQPKEKDRMLFKKIKEQIINGSTLSEAIRESDQFTPYEFFSLQIGEESGKIGQVLKELAAYFQKRIKQRRQVVSALTYPSIVLFASAGAVFFMMSFIVPMFADIFKRFGGDLPFLTKIILNISDVIRQYFLIFLFLFLAVVCGLYQQREKVWFRRISAAIMLRLPLFGEIIRKIYLARFCHSMTLLIGSKVSLLRAISLVKQMISFYPIEVSLTSIEKSILRGDTLHSSLGQFSIYHKRMVSLIKVGEEVNQLDDFFDKIAKQYSEDVEHQTALISSLIEPFMIIFLGLVVGLILIAMYLPLFSLSNSI
jgi:type IV pilus assembly protein PilC